jgi:hypothetical protein
MRKRIWPPKNDRERALGRMTYNMGWDDAFREKLRRPEAATVMRDSISLRGEATDEWGNDRCQSMLVVHATLHNEHLINVDIICGRKDAQYEMTIEEATLLAAWLTKRIAPRNLRMPAKQVKPKGPTNG